MDITQIKSPQAQPNVEPKVVMDKPGSAPRASGSDSIENIVAEQQEKVNLQNKLAQQSNAQMNERLTRQVSKINEFVQSIQRDLEFSVDDDSGKTVVRVFNSHTKEMVRQIPSEEALLLAERIKQNREDTSGLILKTKV